MSEIQVAARYAKSLIDLAAEEHVLEAVKQDIEQFIRTCKENQVLRAVLKNPIIKPDKKSAILEDVFGSSFHKVVISFFKIVTAKGRSEILYATAKEFISEYNKRKGIVKATVTSAAPLSEENKRQITEVVKEAVKGEVVLDSRIDPALIGGFVLKVGDKQFDASISSSLYKLKKEFDQKGIV